MSYILFARWFGLVSVFLSLGILFNFGDARAMAKRMIDNESGYVMGGVLPIIFGTLALISQHGFAMNWQLVVNIAGLILLLIGLFRVMLVTSWRKVMHRHLDKIPALFSLFGLMLGLLLLYVGFFAQLLQYQHLI